MSKNIDINIDINSVSKSNDNFSFIEKLFEMVNNNDFIQNAHSQFNSQTPTEYSYIYNALSVVGDKIMSDIYTSTMNYIDDVTNIDLCKIKSLQSFAKLLGINYNIFNDINKIPVDILNLLDILTLNPVYLVNSNFINEKLALQLSSKLLNKNGNKLKIDVSDFDNILTNLYKDVIVSKLQQKYNDVDKYYIYQELSQSILLSSFQLPENSSDAEYIQQLKNKYNIKQNFNEKQYTDYIENGISALTDFITTEQEIITYEINRRKNSKNQDILSTRYFYYKEKEVKEYYDFVTSYNTNTLSNYIVENYDIDSSYVYLSNNPSDDNIYNGFLSADENKTNCILRNDYIDNVVQQLVVLTKYIREIREQLKSQTQKNFMKGAFVLISHIIKEYICQLTKQDNNFVDIDYDIIDVAIQEYYDITEYYNISTDILADKNHLNLNAPYYQNTNTIQYIVPYNSNNIFKLPNIKLGKSSGISEIDINTLYKDVLNTNFKTSADIIIKSDYSNQLSVFLDTIYKSQTEKMYLSGNTIVYFDVDNNEKYISLTDELIDEFEQYKRNVFLKYTQNNIGYTPYAYNKNTVHPSYELHPYIRQFIEKTIDVYPIADIINLIDNNLSTVIIKNINNYIDTNGYLISAWNNPCNTNNDYQSVYENSTNINELNIVDKIVDYNGLFYPQAIDEFINGKDTFIDALKQNTNEYYEGLNLSKKDRTNIADSLSKAHKDIENIYNGKYTIEKFFIDIYDTEYFWLKQDNNNLIYFKQKNHAIALPIQQDISTKNIIDIGISQNGIYIYIVYSDKIQLFEIQKLYDTTENCTINKLTNLKSIDTLNDNFNDYTYKIYTSLDNCMVFIYAKLIEDTSNKKLDIKLKTIDLTDKSNINQSTNNEPCIINLQKLNGNIDDIQFDITQKGLLTIAYIGEIDITNSSRKNHIGIDYNKDIINYDCLQNLIITHDFTVTTNKIKSKQEDKPSYYNEHTDLGFIPIKVGIKNEINNTEYITKKYAVYKCELFGISTDIGINFKFTAPLRSYVNKATNYSQLEFLAFDKDTNVINTGSISTDNKYDLRKALSGQYLPFKSDEGYIEDPLVEYPEIETTSSYITHDNISKLNNNLHILADNTAVISFVNNNRLIYESLTLTSSNNYNQISVQWFNNNGKIQLDFNAYYAKELSNITSIDNTRNNKHLFLNLNYPGSAGYLNIYSNLNSFNSTHEQIQRYYIKNISDDKPKFIISAEISQNENSYNNYKNILNSNILKNNDNKILVFNQPNNVIEYVEVKNY